MSASLATEQWRQVPGLAVEVSNFGRARTLAGRPISLSGPSPSDLARRPNRKYLYFAKKRLDGTVSGTKKIHVAMLEAFVGPRPEGFHADHINHDATDNRLSNLRWRFASDNVRDTNRARILGPSRRAAA